MEIKTKKKIGAFLFKYRGQLPVILIVISIPVIFNKQSNERTIHPFIEVYGVYFSFILMSLGHLIRSIAIGYKNLHTSGKNRDQQVAEKLNTLGVYSLIRHPLYLGNFLIWIGLTSLLNSIFFLFISSLFFILMYYFIIQLEEIYLRDKFKKEHEKWSEKTLIFIPKLTNYKRANGPFNWKMVWKNEYPGICATLSCIWFIELVKIVALKEDILNFNLICSAFLIFSFGFGSKLLKHKTTFFPKEG